MDNNVVAWIIVLASLIISALGVVMFLSQIVAAVMLALVSAVLTVALFIMGLVLAAIMELSVCAGLVTAVFATTISLTKENKNESPFSFGKDRIRRFWALPVVLLVLAAVILFIFSGRDITIVPGTFADAASRQVLWGQRSLDILALALIILAGVLGVAVLFKGEEEK